jgi:2-polyprenyl-3-methyl-5-hydroxy-6-metoxy-1,4-benzoquinol methylase
MTIQSQPPAVDFGATSFAETSYGIVKRLRAIERWTATVAQWRKTETLSILDYGCGTGDHVTYPMARLGHRVLGVDFHPESIEEARRRYRLPNLMFRAADVEMLAQENAVFDLVICSEVLEHVHKPMRFLQAIHRLIAGQGGLIITTPNGYGSFEWLSALERTFDRLGVNRLLRRAWRTFQRRPAYEPMALSGEAKPSIGYLNMDSTHVQFFRLAELESLFAQSGFRVVERQPRTLLCGPYADVVMHLLPWRECLYRFNGRIANRLPITWAADWMYLLQPKGT